MVSILPSQPLPAELPDYQQAWQMVLSQLRQEMSNSMFETWVVPLRPLGFEDGTFKIGALNPYARDWVDSRLRSRLSRLLEGLYRQDLAVEVLVTTQVNTTTLQHRRAGCCQNSLLISLPTPASCRSMNLPTETRTPLSGTIAPRRGTKTPNPRRPAAR
jgi:chromosomal replication initiation ATPase DnaA